MTVVSSPPVRSPLAVRAAALLLVPLALASATGAALFTFVWGDAASVGTVFGVFALVTTATVLAAVPSLLRREATGWAVAFVWACSYSYWSVYKVFVEQELSSVPFLVAGLSVVALLASPSARTAAGIAR